LTVHVSLATACDRERLTRRAPDQGESLTQTNNMNTWDDVRKWWSTLHGPNTHYTPKEIAALAYTRNRTRCKLVSLFQTSGGCQIAAPLTLLLNVPDMLHDFREHFKALYDVATASARDFEAIYRNEFMMRSIGVTRDNLHHVNAIQRLEDWMDRIPETVAKYANIFDGPKRFVHECVAATLDLGAVSKLFLYAIGI
jgi:hypothetical protein